MTHCTTLEAAAIEYVFHDLDTLRRSNPLVHNLTNFVVMQTTANILLAVGASPLMAHAKEELADIVAIANSLVINIGTLDDTLIQSIEFAQRYALQKNIPIVFDPVGAGASNYRTQAAHHILQTGVHVLRGNPSEILALIDNANSLKPKGVDACHQSDEALNAGKVLAEKYQCNVVISGKTDFIINEKRMVEIPYGTSLFTSITGMGCSATALIGAFTAINNDYFNAASHAITLFTLAGQLAAKKSKGPASFYTALIDTLFSFNKQDILGIINAY